MKLKARRCVAAATALSTQDVERFTELHDDYVARGMEPNAAGLAAARDLQAELQSDRAELNQLVKSLEKPAAAAEQRAQDPRNDKDAGYVVESPKAGYGPSDKQIEAAIKGVKPLDKAQTAALTKWIASRPDSARIVANLREHAKTPWARQSIEGALTRAAIEEYAAGRKPDFDSFLSAPTAKGLRALLESNGADGVWMYLAREGVVGNSSKPVNSVSSSFIDCNPSKDCANFCYAAKGNFAFGASVRKSELVTWAVEKDPVRVAQLMASEYSATLEFQHQKALRLFDKGDGTDAWVRVIEALNANTGPDGKPAPIRIQVFSKNPEFLRKVPAMNLAMLSADKSNVDVVRANPDLPVAFVYTDESQVEFLAEIKDRIQVILPVKQGVKLLDQVQIDALPAWTKPKVCPVDDGRVKIGPNRFQRTEGGSTLTTDKGLWNCTRCDKNGGVGCFHGSVTAKALAAGTSAVHTRGQDEINRITDEIRAVSGRLSPSRRAELLGSLDRIVSAIRAGIDTGTEGTGRAGDDSRIGSDDGWQSIRITRRGNTEEGGGGQSVEAPRRKYDDRQLTFDYQLRPGEGGEAAERAKREAVAAVNDLRSTDSILGAALSRDYAARQRVTLVGQQVQDVVDLAVLAQVYRDPRFETMRVFFTNAQNKVISQIGLTSRMPASAPVIVGNDAVEYIARLSGRAQMEGATGFFLLHNHPSGTMKASDADVRLTDTFSTFSALEFKGHVILDTNKFVFLHGQKGKPIEERVIEMDFPQPAPAADMTRGESEAVIDSPQALAELAQRVAHDDSRITLIGLDAQLKVLSIADFPKEQIAGRHMERQIARFALKSAAMRVAAVGRDRIALRSMGNSIIDAIHVSDDGSVSSLRSKGEIRARDQIHPGDRLPRMSPDTSQTFEYLRPIARKYTISGVPRDRYDLIRGAIPTQNAAEDTARYQTQTPEFKAWFGDSKVVNPDGTPMVVYHGTGSDFTEFNPSEVGARHVNALRDLSEAGIDPTAFYFTADAKTADWYAKSSAKQTKGGANVMPVYLSITNPLEVDFQGEGIEFLAEELERAKNGGHDGLIARSYNDGRIADHYIAFRPEQIKSAIGNRGTFDPANPDITFSIAQPGRGVALAPAAVQSIADSVSARWKNAPPIRVIASMAEAPAAVGAEFTKQQSGGATGSVGGFWWGGEVWLVADGLRTNGEVLSALFHETLGHYGLQGAFGQELDSILDGIANVRRAEVALKAQQYGLDPADPRTRRRAAEELLAEMAQTNPQLGWVRKAIAAIRKFLRNLIPSLQVTDDEIVRDYLTPARAFVERGASPAAMPAGAAASRGAPVWFSPLDRALSALPQASGTVDQWKGIIRNLTQKGVKSDEIEWSGVMEWLDTQSSAGTPKVTKDDILVYLRENGVRVTETMLGGDAIRPIASRPAVMAMLRMEDNLGFDTPGEALSAIVNDWMASDNSDGTVDQWEFSNPENRQMVIDYLHALQNANNAVTKYESYTLPGGADYRELLLMLPPTFGQQKDLDIGDRKVTDLSPEERARYFNFQPQDRAFQSPHWDQPNILAHVRFNERTDADGKLVLFIEEIQSDWAQKGKKEGFDAKQRPALETLTELPEGVTVRASRKREGRSIISAANQREYDRIVNEMERAGIQGEDVVRQLPDGQELLDADEQVLSALLRNDLPDQQVFTRWLEIVRRHVPDAFAKDPYRGESAVVGVGVFRDGSRIAWSETEADARAAALSVINSELRDRWLNWSRGIPSAPFVTKTEAWVALAIKRMVRYAAENGFDRVAFVSGEQSADRYDLSKRIEMITAYRETGGGFRISATDVNGRTLPAQKAKDASALADLVGKELAEKIVNQKGVVEQYTGLDLKIGGAGMKAFYDKIVPTVARDVLKKLGAPEIKKIPIPSINASTVNIGTYGMRQLSREEAMDLHRRGAKILVQVDAEGGPTYNELHASGTDFVFGLYGDRHTFWIREGAPTQLGFDITDKMREAALQGLPMFTIQQRMERAMADGKRAVENIRAGGFKGFWQQIKDTAATRRDLALAFLGRRQLVDIYGKDLPPLVKYNDRWKLYDADKNVYGVEADALVGRWRKLRLNDADLLADTMHMATRENYDPDPKVAGRESDYGLRGAIVEELDGMWASLSPEAQAIYRDARDMYAKHWAAVEKAIGKRIERAQVSENRKRELMERVRQEFTKPIKGVYFPLARFGEFIVTARAENGEILATIRAESIPQAKAEQARLQAEFPNADVSKVIKDKEYNAARDSVSRTFVTELFGLIESTTPTGKQADELKDAINQLYLRSLPDVSWAKHTIHRKGVPGYSNDARRAFASAMFHGGYHLAKLNHADILSDHLREMQEHVDAHKADPEYDSIAGQQVVDEMDKRHNLAMNPAGGPIGVVAENATAMGFLWFLGLSPSSAIVNLTQTALVSYPMMGAKWGYKDSANALRVASEQALRAKNDLTDVLKGDEKRAFDQAVAEGTIDLTQAHDLAAISEGRDSALRGTLAPVMKVASYMFHQAERFNRQATFIASYRLARKKGLSHDSAYRAASDMTYDSHFDYSQGNRARVMMGPVARVLLLFKQYAQNMTYTLARNFYLATRGDKEARKVLAGLMFSHGLTAGLLGLPTSSMILGLASLLGGSDDEPWDAEVALRNLLADVFGRAGGEMVAHGIFRGLIPGDIASRVGLDQLFIRDIDLTLDPNRVYQEILAAILGPVVGIGMNVARGAGDLAKGDLLRGVEQMLPKAIGDPIKTTRYMQEGVIDRTGVEVVKDLEPQELVSQFFGFSPGRVREAYEGRFAVQQHKRAIDQRHTALLREFSRAVIDHNNEARMIALEKIRAFNAAQPQNAITGQSMLRSVQARMRRIQEAQNGIYLPRKQRGLAEIGRFANTE